MRARAEREILPPVIADEMAKTYGDVLAQRRRGAEGMANEKVGPGSGSGGGFCSKMVVFCELAIVMWGVAQLLKSKNP